MGFFDSIKKGVRSVGRGARRAVRRGVHLGKRAVETAIHVGKKVKQELPHIGKRIAKVGHTIGRIGDVASDVIGKGRGAVESVPGVKEAELMPIPELGGVNAKSIMDAFQYAPKLVSKAGYATESMAHSKNVGDAIRRGVRSGSEMSGDVRKLQNMIKGRG